MQKILEINISNLRTYSEANIRDPHWAVTAKRKRKQKEIVKAFWNLSKKDISLPCTVKLTRIAPRALDEGDNLPISLKMIRDAIADCIKPGYAPGRADSKDITFEYAQHKGDKPRFYAVKIEIYKND